MQECPSSHIYNYNCIYALSLVFRFAASVRCVSVGNQKSNKNICIAALQLGWTKDINIYVTESAQRSKEWKSMLHTAKPSKYHANNSKTLKIQAFRCYIHQNQRKYKHFAVTYSKTLKIQDFVIRNTKYIMRNT